MFLVITDEMLQGSSDALLLDTIAVMAGKSAREDAVFGEGFKPAPAERRPLGVDRWTQDDVRALCYGLVGHQLADFVQELGVPGCAEGGGAGETCCWDAVEEAGAADAVGAV